MGSDSTRLSVKCRCNKRVKKSGRVPQRGPGVAELEKILGHQPPQPRPFSAFHFPHWDYFGRRTGVTGVFSNMMRSEPIRESNPDPNYGLNYTQMMTMDDDHPLFRLCMNSVYPFYPTPTANPGLDSLTQHSPYQNLYNKNGLGKIQPGQPSMENSNAPTVPQKGIMLVKNAAEGSKIDKPESSDKLTLTLSLGRPSPKEQSSLPIIPIADGSSKSQESHQTQIFGFNLKGKEPSMDETELSLSNNADATSSVEHDLDLHLKL